MHKKIVRDKTGFRVTHINRRRACRFMCLECVGWEPSEIDKCKGVLLDGSVCQLKDFRFMTGKQDAKKRNKAIRNHCLECMGGSFYTVANCKSPLCPLFPFRNVTIDKTTLHDSKITDEAILNRVENSA